jgi:hypothetical protein
MTPEDVHDELQNAMRELRLELREMRVDIRERLTEMRGQLTEMREQLQRIKLLIWLPVGTGLIQIIVAIITHKA